MARWLVCPCSPKGVYDHAVCVCGVSEFIRDIIAQNVQITSQVVRNRSVDLGVFANMLYLLRLGNFLRGLQYNSELQYNISQKIP